MLWTQGSERRFYRLKEGIWPPISTVHEIFLHIEPVKTAPISCLLPETAQGLVTGIVQFIPAYFSADSGVRGMHINVSGRGKTPQTDTAENVLIRKGSSQRENVGGHSNPVKIWAFFLHKDQITLD